MVVFPNAKINIGLFVTNRRDDGYHDLETVMVPVPWCDILEIVPSKNNNTSLTVTGRAVECPPEKNLVMKAYRALAEYITIPPVDIYLHKIIPDGAGLGGGSADAAFTLLVLNELSGLELSKTTLAQIAATLGADCPFFIYNSPMLATGIGTTLSSISLSLTGYVIAIIKPAESVSTAEAYRGCCPIAAPDNWVNQLTETAPELWLEMGVTNDFEKTILPLHPSLAKIKQRLRAVSAIYESMSGSGSAIYGIFPPGTSVEHLKQTLQDPSESLFVATL